MRSPDRDPRLVNAVRGAMLCAALAVVGGCSSMPAGGPPDRPARESAVHEAAQDRQPPARAEPAVREAAQDRQPPIAAMERKRGDYPEIEVGETGFTITEQVRIGGDVRADYQEALQLLRQERYEEGIPLLVAVTEEAPDVTAPYINLGIAYERSGDLERAEAALETASTLSPTHPIVHNELGILYRKTGRFAAARASYEKALATYPGFHFARRNLAVLCDLYLADLDCALENYEAYMESVVEDEQVAIWIADIRNRLGR